MDPVSATQFPHVFGFIFGYCWDLLSFTMPGFAIDCKTFVLGLITINITITAMQYVFGLVGPGSGYRSGQSRRKYISEKRKGDTH